MTNCDKHVTILPHQGSCIQSDHFILYFYITRSIFTKIQISPRYIFDYSKADWDGLSSYLFDYDFSPILHLNDIEACWSSLKQLVLSALSLFVPKVKLRRHQRPKWFTSDIQNHLNKVHSLRKKARSTPSPRNLTNFASSESLLQAEMSEAKLNYESHLVSTFAVNKNYKIFNYLHSLTTQNTLPATVCSGSLTASSDADKANLFNQYFHFVFTRSNYSLLSLQDPSADDVFMNEITISESDVYEALAALDPNKAMGIDGIGPNVLKFCATSLCGPIHHPFSLCSFSVYPC